MTFSDLTPSQLRVFNSVKKYIEQHRYPPTLQEIAKELKIQFSAVRMHLLYMEKKGVLRYVPKVSRGIELLYRKPEGVPIYGSAPAGHPFSSQENIVDSFEVQRYLSSSRDVFGIYVRGDSMKGAQLASGDLLFVDPHREPRNGDIVVAAVEKEPTIKRYYREGTKVLLKPENPKYSDIEIMMSDDGFRIFGVVVGMVRALDKKKIDALTEEHRSFSKMMRA